MIGTILLVCGVLLMLAGVIWYMAGVVRHLEGPSEAICVVLVGGVLIAIVKAFFS